ncbi:TB2/DP1/HVA22-related protein [Parasponia andersonii]|uniref:TB2/DP1/HVA22-related protein n=1 Tax=Parasponia andersonii TaxID=3476 RepID=A0A2P5CEY9_PARAD|nr:TB2/DP1/HVA22-related protein [Parasponia andersonii]
MMGWEVFLTLLAKLFTVFSWPSFTLVYPLYASVQAIESDSESKNQQCLTYWVLFALFRMSESLLAKLLKWLPFWPYVKGVITVFLVVQCFAGACYIYDHFVRSHLENSLIRKVNVDSISREEHYVLSVQENFVHVVEQNVFNSELHESDRFITSQEPAFDYKTTKSDDTWPLIPNKVQKEWCCALCLISTSCEKNLIGHHQGKKHRAKEEDLLLYKLAKKNGKSSVMLTRTNGILIENLNQIAVNCCNLLTPPIFCTWRKPKFGWTKLNTDGSIDRKGAGFGGLFRDYKGRPLCAFVSKAPTDDVFSVELWAIWRGLILALGLGIKVIWVESDSMSAVNTINRRQSCSQKSINCLNHIWELLRKFDKYMITHSWRETNTAADYLAKTNLSGNDVVLWPANFPEKLRIIIKDDAQGRIYVRHNS